MLNIHEELITRRKITQSPRCISSATLNIQERKNQIKKYWDVAKSSMIKKMYHINQIKKTKSWMTYTNKDHNADGDMLQTTIQSKMNTESDGNQKDKIPGRNNLDLSYE